MTQHAAAHGHLQPLAGGAKSPPPSAFGAGAHATRAPNAKRLTEPQDGGHDFALAVPLDNLDPPVTQIYTRAWTMADVRLWQEWEAVHKDEIGGGVQMLAGLSGLTASEIEAGMHPNDLEDILKFYEAELERYRLMAVQDAGARNATTEGKTFTFNVAVEADGRTYQQLPFRYPTIKDTKEGSKHNLQVDQSMSVFAGMSGAPRAVFLNMHPYDFHRLEAWLAPLLQPRSQSSGMTAAEINRAEVVEIAKSVIATYGSGSL